MLSAIVCSRSQSTTSIGRSGPAEASKVGNPEAWGSYYQSGPRVVAIHDAMVSLGADAKDSREAALLA